MGDFTPNYLCNADAMGRIRRSASTPSAYRFVVVMREPVARAFSEWRMFALKYRWERERQLHLRDGACGPARLRRSPQLHRSPQAAQLTSG